MVTKNWLFLFFCLFLGRSYGQTLSCSEWQQISFSDSFYGTAEKDGLQILLGDAGVIYSREGNGPWQKRDSGIKAGFSGIAANQERFVAVGGGAPLSSEDGVVWTGHGLPEIGNSNSIVWTGSQFVMDVNKSVALSVDGLEWRLVPTEMYTLRMIIYGGRIYRAGSTDFSSGSAMISYSDDGEHWTTLLTGEWKEFIDIAVGDKGILATTERVALFSQDGLVWNKVERKESSSLGPAGWNGEYFLQVAKPFTGNFEYLISRDGQNWEERIGLVGIPRRLQINQGKFLLFGLNGLFAQSNTDLDFEYMVNPANATSGFHWTGTEFKGFQYGQTISSPNGIDWHYQTMVGFKDLIQKLLHYWFPFSQVIRDQDRYYAIGAHGTLATSPDGITWERRYAPSDEKLISMARNGATWVILTESGRFLTSLDNLASWRVPALVPGRKQKKVIFNGHQFVSFTDRVQKRWVSQDGLTWNEEPMIIKNRGSFEDPTIEKFGSRWLAIDRAVYTSSDTSFWTRVEQPTFAYLTRFEDILLASGQYGISASSDGQRWVYSNVDYPYSARNAIAWNGSELVSINEKGISLCHCTLAPDPEEMPLLDVIPWVVNNQNWSSRVAIFNNSKQDAHLRLTAVTTTGERAELPIAIGPESIFARQAGELFGEMTGYSLFLSGEASDIHTSFLTFNKEEISGGNSPSQTVTIPFEELTQKLQFGYVPGDQIAAIVLVAPEGLERTRVSLTLFDESGHALESRDLDLEVDQPVALLIKDLFPGATIPIHASLRAESSNGSRLAGTTFVFDLQRQPSMAVATPIRQRNRGDVK